MYKYNAISEEVLKYVSSIPFNEEGYFTEEDVEWLISDIEENVNFSYETGATKCVIIPANTGYVIKIPFNAITVSCCDCEETNLFSCNRSRCPFNQFSHGGGVENSDYCALEVDLYNQIKESYNQFKDFFLPTIKICEVDNYPIYIQKKAEIFSNISIFDKKYSPSKVSEEKVMSHSNFVSAPVEWLARCLEYLHNNLDLYNDFLSMLKTLGIDKDLHRGNVGYYHGHPVLIDYAGFSDK